MNTTQSLGHPLNEGAFEEAAELIIDFFNVVLKGHWLVAVGIVCLGILVAGFLFTLYLFELGIIILGALSMWFLQYDENRPEIPRSYLF